MAHKFSEQALEILNKRYLAPDETPEERFMAIAQAVNPEMAEQYYELMISLDFLPNSPTIMNAGRAGQLAACFVVPVNDSMHDILMAAYSIGMIQKTGGGTGLTLSRLRPQGALVTTTRGVSSGPISFLHMYDAITETIEQGGTRRGASMATMSCHHPNIEQFITCKDVEGKLKNFNISVMITDDFMWAVQNNEIIPLFFNGRSYGTVSAPKIFEMIVEQSWKNGEPGVIFIDTINKAHPKELGIIDATNPCGEQPLLDNESCNLGSINLVNMLIEDKHGWCIDDEKLIATAKIATRFLDEIISVTKFPLPQIEEATLRTRKIGLGVMGWGNALVKMGIPYGSNKAHQLAEAVMYTISHASNEESLYRGEKFGPYPAWTEEQGPPYRNATRTTIAPTGSLATLAGVSYGIEPLFGLTYTKKMVDRLFTYVNEDFLEYIGLSVPEYEEHARIMNVVQITGSCQDIEAIPQEVRDIFKTAHDIPYDAHINMQAAFQKHTNNAVSKTINFPNHATKDDFRKAIILAYNLGCKGLTMYRSGTRREEAVTVGQPERNSVNVNMFRRVIPMPRPKRVEGFTEQAETGCGKLYVTINSAPEPIETFIEPGAEGGCEAYGKALSRIISLSLRAGVDPKEISRQLRKVTCKSFIRRSAKDSKLIGKSCPDVVGRILESAIQQELKVGTIEEFNVVSGDGDLVVTYQVVPCPGCGNSLTAAEGCWVCSVCGYNECSG